MGYLALFLGFFRVILDYTSGPQTFNQIVHLGFSNAYGIQVMTNFLVAGLAAGMIGGGTIGFFIKNKMPENDKRIFTVMVTALAIVGVMMAIFHLVSIEVLKSLAGYADPIRGITDQVRFWILLAIQMLIGIG